MIFRTSLDIDLALVYRYAGYRNGSRIPERIKNNINEFLARVFRLIQPSVVYEETCFCVDKENRRLVLTEDLYFSSEYPFLKLRDSEYLIIAVATLGKEYEQITQPANEGIWAAMIYDAIGNAALSELNRQFRQHLIEMCGRKGKGLTCQISPGDKGWPLEEQQTVFKLIDPSLIGVELNEYNVMTPLKSLSMVYGVLKNGRITREHNCGVCNMTNCMFRDVNDHIDHEYQITIIEDQRCKLIRAYNGNNLFTLLTDNDISISNSCGGNKTCSKCMVYIEAAEPIKMYDSEKKLLAARRAPPGFRIACFIDIHQDMKVTIPASEDKAQILVGGREYSFAFDPRVRVIDLDLAAPNLVNQTDDLLRLHEALPFEIVDNISLTALKKLPLISDNRLRAIVYNHEILDLEAFDERRKHYGIALDIGTTTIAVYLIDFATGAEVDVCSSLNPQKKHGSDVIARINSTMLNKKALQDLNNLIVAELNRLINVLCSRNDLSPKQIYEIVMVGNNTMLHFLLEVSCQNMANSPFIPAFTSKLNFNARNLGIDINPEGQIVVLPSVSAYVGADTMAALLAAGAPEDENINLLIDIGTNGEITLGNKDKIVCCSTAAGPAFEGGKITWGVGGIAGAIDHVNFNNQKIYTTIGNKAPVGICGSGILDTMAELIRYDMVEKSGKMRNEGYSDLDPQLSKRLVRIHNTAAFILDEEYGIVFTQGDVRELQLAKAAIHAAIEVLVDDMAITYDQIKNVYLAGGFGNYLDITSAICIKLIPRELKDKIVPVGNAAGIGAKIALLSDRKLRSIMNMKKRIQYIELSASKRFQNKFIHAMSF